MKRQVIEAIEKYNKFVVVTHINPDGNASGSTIAMTAYLKDMGKEMPILQDALCPPMPF